MNEIIVKTQEELDDVPLDYHGRIIIKFGTWINPAMLNKAYDYASVVLRDNTRVVLWDNASAVLRGNASAVLWDNARAELWDNARAELWDNASAEAGGNSSTELWGNASTVLRSNASSVLCDNARAELWDNARAILWDNARAELWDNARVELRENASAVLWDNAEAELRGNARAEASGNAQIVDINRSGRAAISGNARIVYLPQNLDEFIAHYGVKCDGEITLYKAVHKHREKYFSNYDDGFEYKIGEVAVPDNGFNDDASEQHGAGIHMATIHWCLDAGRRWDNLAMLEMTARREDVVVPINTDGYVRARKAKVVREVPLSECGIYGEMLAKRRGDSND